MILANQKQKKGQVMVLDILILFIIVIFIISIEEKNITNYSINIKNKNQEINTITQELIVDRIISDCNYLATSNQKTNVCYANNIAIKNLDNLDNNICYLAINSTKYYALEKQINQIYKRGVVYNNRFAIIEVGFCE